MLTGAARLRASQEKEKKEKRRSKEEERRREGEEQVFKGLGDEEKKKSENEKNVREGQRREEKKKRKVRVLTSATADCRSSFSTLDLTFFHDNRGQREKRTDRVSTENGPVGKPRQFLPDHVRANMVLFKLFVPRH